MITGFRRILFPTDFSDCADHALEHCLALARALDASVTLLHVQVMLDTSPAETDRKEMEALLDRFHGHGAGRLERRAAGNGGDIDVETAIVRGFSPAEEIINILRAGDHDLLVIGTHGRGWMGRMLLGSVASQVIRLSPVPVYSVREGLAVADFSSGKGRLVVPVDFSSGSRRALAMAGDLASSNFAVMDVVHVMEKPDYPVFYPEARVATLEARLEERCLEQMKQDVADHCPPGLRIDYHVLEGRPHVEIVRHAGRSGAGLVVIAERGLGDSGPHLLGSTVEKVVAACNTAVLTVDVPPGSKGD